MDIFGIGPLEVAFILILVIIIFNPRDLAKTGKAIGSSLNKLIRSDAWKTINQTSREIKNLPNRLMREAGLDELEKMKKEGLAHPDNIISPKEVSSLLTDIPPVTIPSPAAPGQKDAVEPPEKNPSK
jgi:Sec-independent protein translocase protein TatA